MEDFIGKPVEPANLFSTIIKWLPGAGNAPQTPLSDELPKKVVLGRIERRAHPDTVVDVEVLNCIFADDRNAQQMLLKKFTSQADDIAAQFETAFTQHDMEQIRFHAHKLKSSARTVGAYPLAELCLALEIAAQNTDWAEIKGLAVDLKPAVKRVEDYIKGF